MTVISPENFGSDGALTMDGPTHDFLGEQAGQSDGLHQQLSLSPVMKFYGETESKAFAAAARWAEKYVDGAEVTVLSTFFRHIDDDLDDEPPWEFGLVLEVM
ncbi:hypothetical protein ACWCWD_29495 [Streptomyces sp. NPDC001493]